MMLSKPFALSLALLVTMTLSGTTAAEASCGGSARGPEVSLSASSGTSGITITVAGHDFLSAVCNDTGIVISSSGALVSAIKPEKSKPAAEIKIEFQQGDRSQELATTKADKKGTFSAKVKIPANAQAGPSTIVVKYAFAEKGAMRFRSDQSRQKQFVITMAPSH